MSEQTGQMRPDFETIHFGGGRRRDVPKVDAFFALEAEIADLRRQLAESEEEWRKAAIEVVQTHVDEMGNLRRQLEEAKNKLNVELEKFKIDGLEGARQAFLEVTNQRDDLKRQLEQVTQERDEARQERIRLLRSIGVKDEQLANFNRIVDKYLFQEKPKLHAHAEALAEFTQHRGNCHVWRHDCGNLDCPDCDCGSNKRGESNTTMYECLWFSPVHPFGQACRTET